MDNLLTQICVLNSITYTAVVEETKKPNAEDLDVQHFIGLDERQSRLVLFQGAADAEGGTLTVPKSVLARLIFIDNPPHPLHLLSSRDCPGSVRHPSVTVHTKLKDMYISRT
jgi:hypothetical protein